MVGATLGIDTVSGKCETFLRRTGVLQMATGLGGMLGEGGVSVFAREQQQFIVIEGRELVLIGWLVGWLSG